MRSQLLLTLLLPFAAFCQKAIDVDKNNINPLDGNAFYVIGGQPYSEYKYVRVVSGTPYFKEDWMKALVLTGSGTRVQGKELRLDLLSGDLLFKDSIGQEMIATTPVRQITFNDPKGPEYTFIRSFDLGIPTSGSETGWYQVLATGNVTLYKKIRKTVTERQPFNSATKEQTINTINTYILLHNNSATVIKKWKELPSMLADKKDKIEQYISSKNLTGKNDADFIDVIGYYNSAALN